MVKDTSQHGFELFYCCLIKLIVLERPQKNGVKKIPADDVPPKAGNKKVVRARMIKLIIILFGASSFLFVVSGNF
jgi:hypothetical protein